MPPSDEDFVVDMARACQEALGYVVGLSQEQFMDDRRTQRAVERTLEVLGEAAKRVSPEFRERHPHISWRKAAGMRDKLIHEYDRVDLELMWDTLQEDLPRLLEELQAI